MLRCPSCISSNKILISLPYLKSWRSRIPHLQTYYAEFWTKHLQLQNKLWASLEFPDYVVFCTIVCRCRVLTSFCSQQEFRSPPKDFYITIEIHKGMKAAKQQIDRCHQVWVGFQFQCCAPKPKRCSSKLEVRTVQQFKSDSKEDEVSDPHCVGSVHRVLEHLLGWWLLRYCK